MRDKLNKILDFIQKFFVSVAIFVVLFLIASRLIPNFGYGIFAIKSGSMEPKIKAGSVILDKKFDEYSQRDVITFLKSKNNFATHRIVEVSEKNKETVYKTKGDNNEEADPVLIKKNQIVGKVIFYIPYFGYVINFARTKMGIVLLILVPSLWLITEESIKLVRMIKKRRAAEGESKIV